MSLPRLALILIAIIVLGEGALALWRNRPVEPSTAPVFSFPPAAANFGKSPNLAPAIEMYGADLGAEYHVNSPDGLKVTVFYFEWDLVKTGAGPLTEGTGHLPEVCNVAAGFNLQKILPERTHSIDSKTSLLFDVTHFKAPSGQDLYIFKMPWVQGIGPMSLRAVYDRKSRLQKSLNIALSRSSRSARLVQGGVFDAKDCDHAWEIFRQEVIDQLEWR